jgi:hypothetical protein
MLAHLRHGGSADRKNFNDARLPTVPQGTFDISFNLVG